MRNLVDVEKLYEVMDMNDKAALVTAFSKVPIEEKYYSEADMDYFVKIGLALVEKFRDQLNAEYGSDMWSNMRMFKKLYDEQNKKMPEMWYKYGYGVKNES